MRKKLGEILLANRLVTQHQLDEALLVQRQTQQPLGEVLISMGFVTEQLLLQVLAAQQNVGAWHLDRDPPTPEALSKISIKICKQYQILPMQVRGDLLILAMRNPGDIDAIDFARTTSNMRIEPVLASESKLAGMIERLERETESGVMLSSHVSKAMVEIQSRGLNAGEDGGEQDLNVSEDERPVVALVNQIMQDAIRMGASDIHIEPRYNKVDIRLRVDGDLVRVREIPDELQRMLVTRVKIMSEINIAEHRVPQNGRISAKVDGRVVDLRVSTLPNVHGERVVLRILDKAKGIKPLDKLGFTEANMRLYRDLVRKPYGIFLVTGPTGSGKTTTLYAGLSELINVKNNIMTCEDPVEYDIPGINQSQVNEKVGLTFAAQLRAILRQDPDIVLVGEIRDEETALTAMRAAQTGHMVLSTLHTNDAPSALPRLLDMGIEPFLLANTLVGVMAQRLVRVACPNCKTNYQPSDWEKRVIHKYLGPDIDFSNMVQAPGCTECYSIGFRGRMGIHEVLPINEYLKDLIADHAPMERIRSASKQLGFQTMQHDVLWRVLNGHTTLEEAMDVVFFDTLNLDDDNVVHLPMFEAQ